MRFCTAIVLAVGLFAGSVAGCTVRAGEGIPPNPGSPEAECNQLSLGALVEPVAREGEAPVPQAGAITEGRYELVAYELYGAEPTMGSWPARRITVEVSGRTMQLVSAQGSDAPERASFRFETSGTLLSLSRTCGPWTPALAGYTATPTELRLLVSLRQGVGVWTLRRS